VVPWEVYEHNCEACCLQEENRNRERGGGLERLKVGCERQSTYSIFFDREMDGI